MPDRDIAEVRRALPLSPARVFAAFADPVKIARWLSPSADIELTVLEFDFQPGGRYRYAYAVPDVGTMRVNGIFRTIERPALIVFTWNIEPPDVHAGIRSEVTVTLQPDGSGTALNIRHEQLTLPGSATRHAEGWTGALDRLTLLLTEDPTALIDTANEDEPIGEER